MKLKTRIGIFTLIKTQTTKFDLKSAPKETVYSILALYKGDDFPQSKFIYDVSRDEGIARRIISDLNSKTPCIDGLLEAVSEML